MNTHPTATQTSRKSPWLVPMLALGFGLLAGFGGVLFPPATVTLQPGGAQPGPVATKNPSKTDTGRLLYLAHCARCHGPTGQGDGPESAELAASARPRDFTSDDWKFSSSREAIEQVLLKGIPGTPMAAFGATLGDLDRGQLVDYLQALAPPAARLPNDRQQRDFVKNLVATAGWQWSGERIAPDSRLGSSAVPSSEKQLAQVLQQSPQPPTGLHFLQFWGVHCSVCLEKLPEMLPMQSAALARGFGFQLICADEPDSLAVKQFLDDRGLALTSLTDQANGCKLGTDLTLLPTTLIVNASGHVLARYVGLFDLEILLLKDK